ncbi:MAG TPA: agmatinase family protein [Chitinophagaceae bacterium]|nr:agmatinase family protein [Chitinophagaceae bacterium]
MAIDPYNSSGPGLFHNNIFSLPFHAENARLILLPVPWEVTVSFRTGTARAPEHIFQASKQIDVLDLESDNGWKQGFFMSYPDKHLLLRSDYLRKEAELCINLLHEGGKINDNEYLKKSHREINEGCFKMNEWVYKQSREILGNGKLLGLVGGDHSVSLGLFKAIGEKYGDFGILQIDAHCDLRRSYQGFTYSHASVMYNALEEVPQLKKLIQAGTRDFCEEESQRIMDSNNRIVSFNDAQIKERIFNGETWKSICEDIISGLPAKVHLSFDIDGLDPKLCPHTGTPVPGGFDIQEIFFLLKSILNSGRTLIGFDLVEVSYRHDDWDVMVGARVLFRLCNLLVSSH